MAGLTSTSTKTSMKGSLMAGQIEDPLSTRPCAKGHDMVLLTSPPCAANCIILSNRNGGLSWLRS